jgi:N-acetylmuramoyl-L-alanine amidase
MMRTRTVVHLTLCLGFLILGAGFTPSAAAGDLPLAGELICLDPGHGGSDPGAVNPAFSLTESEINLDVAFGLKTLLEGQGAVVVMTRTDNSYKDNADRYTFCNQQAATLLLSVHTNSVTDPTWDGAMALYFRPDVDDQVLAQAIYEVMYPTLRETAPDPEAFRSFGLDWFASGVLLKSDMPAAMLEPLFMSHPEEAELLVHPIFADPQAANIADGCQDFQCRRGQVAQAISQGVLYYYQQHGTGSLHVAAIEMVYQPKARSGFLLSQLTVQDEKGDPVPDAWVSIRLAQPGGSSIDLAEWTGLDGVASFRTRVTQAGRYEVTVSGISKDGWIYDPAANLETSDFLIVP